MRKQIGRTIVGEKLCPSIASFSTSLSYEKSPSSWFMKLPERKREFRTTEFCSSQTLVFRQISKACFRYFLKCFQLKIIKITKWCIWRWHVLDLTPLLVKYKMELNRNYYFTSTFLSWVSGRQEMGETMYWGTSYFSYDAQLLGRSVMPRCLQALHSCAHVSPQMSPAILARPGPMWLHYIHPHRAGILAMLHLANFIRSAALLGIFINLFCS